MRIAPMFLALSLVAAGCGGDADNCTPGSKTACACSGAIQSTKTCLADGSDYGVCVCEGGTGGNGGSGGTSPSASTTTTSARAASSSDASSSSSAGGAANSSSTASAGGASSSSSAGGAGGATSSSSGGSGGGFANQNVVWSDTADAGSIHSTLGGLVVDADDSVIVTGTFVGSIDFGGGNVLSAPDAAVYLAKYDAGGVLVWAKPFSGPAYPLTIAGDPDGGVVVGGMFAVGIDFGGGAALTGPESGDALAFVAKFDSSGVCAWQKQFGGNQPPPQRGTASVESLAVDSSGDIAIVGKYTGTITIDGTSGTDPDGTSNFYVASLNASGAPRWAQMLGKPNQNVRVAVDAIGDIVFAAESQGALVSPTLANTCNSQNCVSLVKLDTSGNVLSASAFGDGLPTVTGLSIDLAEEISFAGAVESGRFSFGGSSLSLPSSLGIYVARFDAAGDFLTANGYAATGSNNVTAPYAFTCAGDGACEIAGTFFGDALNFGCGALAGDATFSAFTARLDSTLACAKSEEVRAPQGGISVSAVGFAANGDTIAAGTYSGTVDFGTSAWPIPSGGGIFLARTSP